MAGTNAIGRLKGLGLGEDNSTFGTYQQPAAGQGLLVREDVSIKEELAILDAAHVRQSIFFNAAERLIGRKGWSAAASFAVPLRSSALKLLIKQAMGTAGTVGLYQRQTTNLTAGQCLQLHTGDGVNQISASGGRPKSLKFKVDPAGLLICDATWIGSTYAVGALAALPVATLHTVPYWQWRYAAATVQGDAFPCSGFELNIDCGVADDDASATTLGSQVATSLPFNGNFSVKGMLNRLYISDGTAESAFDTYARAGTEGAVVITFTSSSDILKFEIECVFGKPTISGAGLITESIPFECRQITGGESITNGPFAITITDGA